MSKHEHLEGLNAPQRQAVEHLTGPLLVLAGAGSGKTRVITHRIIHLIATGTARPDQILAVTFTNKAAGEMKERVMNLLGFDARFVRLSTFHSFCARLLRDHAEALGYKRTFSIYDTSESLALIKRIYKDKGIPDNQPPFNTALNKISNAKERIITPAGFAEQADDFIAVNVANIYAEYQKRLLRNQAFDFDDLLMKTVELFESNPTVLAEYQNRFQYIMIDEYQDTNHAQYRLVNLLASGHHNLCVVGDDDQSIYAWRGADIANILDFEKDYPEAVVIKLEQNYRSTQVILDAAWKVVSQIPGRRPKRLFTKKDGGDKVTLLLCGDERDEAEAIVEKIRLGLIYDKSPSDYAILYRTNAQSRVLEDVLRYKGLPYTIVGGIRFYERAEVKDIISYLRLLVNPADDQALLRIINTPKRGIGKTSIANLEKFAAEHNMPMIEALSMPLDNIGIKGKARAELDKLLALLQKLTSVVDITEPQTIAMRVITESGYLQALEEEQTPESDVRAENVREIVAGITEYVERNEISTLAGFLEEVALLTDIDNWNNNTPSVTLMTLHSAKGLEFDTVFLAGMEDGLFPLMRSFDDKADLEEERRLCYVGMTRAKQKLFLSMAGYRRRWGDFTGGPSMFLKDIPEELVEAERFNYWQDLYAKGMRNGVESSRPAPKPHRSSFKEEMPTESYYEYDDLLPLGTSVMHEKFGRGVIMAREGTGESLIVTIRFERYGTKKIMAKYASLEILGR